MQITGSDRKILLNSFNFLAIVVKSITIYSLKTNLYTSLKYKNIYILLIFDYLTLSLHFLKSIAQTAKSKIHFCHETFLKLFPRQYNLDSPNACNHKAWLCNLYKVNTITDII